MRQTLRALLGTWWPEDWHREWTAVARNWNARNLKAPKRKSFATGSAQTRLYRREHGIDIPQADTAAWASEEAAWYPYAFAAQLHQAAGVRVGISRELVAGGKEGQTAVVKRYHLLSHLKVTKAPASDAGEAKAPAC